MFVLLNHLLHHNVMLVNYILLQKSKCKKLYISVIHNNIALKFCDYIVCISFQFSRNLHFNV
jgi:hypothetical protein